MVVDRSSSMEARDLVRDDVSVNRLAVVKSLFKKFVAGGDDGLEGRPDDVIGLVGFARYADGLCPLTLDHGSLISILDDLEIVTERSEDGTALGEGRAHAGNRYRRAPPALHPRRIARRRRWLMPPGRGSIATVTCS